jgi:hypothetical protein
MKPEKQRIAIAEACGWTVINDSLCHITPDRNGEPQIAAIARLPDYLADLNAMHEAEKHLDVNQQIDYASLITRHFLDEIYHVIPNDLSFHICFPAMNVGADVRAEAFLRTVGKWEES